MIFPFPLLGTHEQNWRSFGCPYELNCFLSVPCSVSASFFIGDEGSQSASEFFSIPIFCGTAFPLKCDMGYRR